MTIITTTKEEVGVPITIRTTTKADTAVRVAKAPRKTRKLSATLQ